MHTTTFNITSPGNYISTSFQLFSEEKKGRVKLWQVRRKKRKTLLQIIGGGVT
jgi:hypothetical protein